MVMPGRYLLPVEKVSIHDIWYQCDSNPNELTSINLLADKVLDGALVSISHRLLLDGAAAIIEAFGFVHGALQCVALPAEHIIGVGAGRSTLEAPQEGIPVLRRIPKAVERCRVPCDFEGYPLIFKLAYTRFGGMVWASEELRSLYKLGDPFKEIDMLWDDLLGDANWVGVGALWSIGEALRVDSVVHVSLMIGAIKVLAIPAASFRC